MLLTAKELEAAEALNDPELDRLLLQSSGDYYTFEPRVDRPEEFDEQASFCEPEYYWDPELNRYVYPDGAPRFKIAQGGNGSGKTRTAAQKTAYHVLETPPPRPRCPFWIIGDYYDVTCDVCWVEKLSQLIPQSEILGYRWYKPKQQWPYAVLLRHPARRSEVGWILEFKSYEQGLPAMKAKSIGGYWFEEETPYPIVAEVQARCRDYDSPGWADFTPIEVKSPEWPEIYDKCMSNDPDAPPGWRFYHLNTELNDALPEGWWENFIATVPGDMRETRRIGTYSSFSGQVFKEFRKHIHVVDPTNEETRRKLKLRSIYPYIKHDWWHIQGVDFGYNNPTCFLWIARDHDGRYYVYDEHYHAQWLHDQHAGEVSKREWDETDPHYGPRYSDHDTQEIAEYGLRGINLIQARKSPAKAIALLRSLMMLQGDGRPRLYIFKNCVNLIREIVGLRWPKGTTLHNPNDLPIDKDNHAVDAACYGIFSDQRAMNGSGILTKRIEKDHRRHGVHLHSGSNGRVLYGH